MSEAQATVEESAEAPATGGGKKRGLMIVVLLVLVAGGVGAAWFSGMFSKHDAAETHEKPPVAPLYFDVDSNLIVNFQGGGKMRYLQLGVEVMTRDAATMEALKTQHPVIRNNLIMLFSEQTYETLSTREGKQGLADAALAEVRRVLHDDAEKPHVEALYFTTFVMQ